MLVPPADGVNGEQTFEDDGPGGPSGSGVPAGSGWVLYQERMQEGLETLSAARSSIIPFSAAEASWNPDELMATKEVLLWVINLPYCDLRGCAGALGVTRW